MDLTDDDKFDQLLSKALEKGSDFELSQGFADRIVVMAESHSLKKESKRDRWWLAIGIASMIGAFVYAFTKVEFAPLAPRVGVFTFLSGYSGLIVFGIVFVIALHIVDKLILRKQESG